MTFRMAFAFALSVIPGAMASVAHAADLELRYVTQWDPRVLVRVTHPDPLEVNSVRYRLAELPKTSPRTQCRVVSVGRLLPDGSRPWDDKRPSWQTPVGDLRPGDYRVVFDMRTPLEALFVETPFRVPQIVRYAGAPIDKARPRETFPQNRFEVLPQDGETLWLAWDRTDLYILPLNNKPLSLSIDLLPVAPGKHVKAVSVAGLTVLNWTDLAPAGPWLGQVLRLKYTESAGTEKEHDLLLTGSGSGIYFGANTVSGVDDDQGPPREQLDALYKMAGFNQHSVGVGLHEFYPESPPPDDAVFDFSSLIRNPKSYSKGLVYCGIDGYAEWMRDKEYEPETWPQLERHAEEAARTAASLGIHYYSLGYNEPELFYRSDNRVFFVSHLTHFADAVRRGDPKARIIAGKFSAGDPGLIRSFASSGFRDNFDVLDIHPYSNDPRTGQDMGGIVAAHEALEELGMGHKQIYLGEGWGPTRNLHQKPRANHDEPVSEAEADFMRQYYWNGYRCLVTPRDDFNPEWILGAHFFTLNDNMGMTYWKHNAIPHYNEIGEIDYFLLSHLRFGDLSDIKPVFFNGGLVDFYARPKGDWFFDFPPALPQIRVQAAPAFDYLLPGVSEKLRITVTNADSLPFTNLHIGLRSRTYKWTGNLLASSVDSVTRDTLAPGESWTFNAEITADNTLPGPLRIAVEVDYHCNNTLYLGDDIVRTEVREPLAAVYEPQRVVLDAPESSAKVSITLRNNNTAPRAIAIPGSDGVVNVSAALKEFTLNPREEKAVTLQVSAPDAAPGISDLHLGLDTYEALSVIRPLYCPRADKPPVIDGDIADWPKSDRRSSLNFPRAAAVADRPSWVPFPVPPPAKASAFESNNGGTEPAADSQAATGSAVSFGAEGAMMWDDQHLYIALWVNDSSHVQDNFALEVWRGDSIQIAIDPKGDGAGEQTVSPGAFLHHAAEENYRPDDYEIAAALTRRGSEIVANQTPPDRMIGPLEGAAVAVKTGGNGTVYEIALPWSSVGMATPKPDTTMGFDVLINNFDGEDRTMLGLADAIGNGKYPSRHIPVRFVRE